MTTTTVLSEDTATIVRDEVSRFNWGAVLAGAVVATAVTFFLVSVGSGLGLALTSVRHPTGSGIKTFLTLGAIYFVAVQAFGLALGGHITGRLMDPADASEEETFRADAHGLAVWALAVVFGLGLLALTTGPGVVAGVASQSASTPVNYWVDKLFRSSTTQQSSVAIRTLTDVKGEAARILTVDAAKGSFIGDDKEQLARLVSQNVGLTPSAATDRVNAVENDMKTSARDAAEAARKAASYVSIWTALALLFGAIVSVAATVTARWEHDKPV